MDTIFKMPNKDPKATLCYLICYVYNHYHHECLLTKYALRLWFQWHSKRLTVQFTEAYTSILTIENSAPLPNLYRWTLDP
ncbi:hypothetical protein AQUCO_00500583v1 [Aquilegia coerulea]|uniref:Uncharacterized protein n=1 Tax=Aquilegia coerulea TaxID=218851 RepID=A0A2G5ESM2_AQUCA|nr:hypothetical protein AQUCO_00500583v1 [Aquilegia coerulea]